MRTNKRLSPQERFAIFQAWRTRRSGMTQQEFCLRHELGSTRRLRNILAGFRAPERPIAEARAIVTKAIGELSTVLERLDQSVVSTAGFPSDSPSGRNTAQGAEAKDTSERQILLASKTGSFHRPVAPNTIPPGSSTAATSGNAQEDIAPGPAPPDRPVPRLQWDLPPEPTADELMAKDKDSRDNEQEHPLETTMLDQVLNNLLPRALPVEVESQAPASSQVEQRRGRFLWDVNF
jgi:hypothetical protein